MDKLTLEYRRYGPWMMEVKALIDIPPQFEHYQQAILAAKYCFKVPVDQARRDLEPGMLMYQSVVILEANRIRVLSFNKAAELQEQALDYADINYIVHSGDLLSCHLQLFSRHHSIHIDYSLVSVNIAAKALHIIRDAMHQHSQPLALTQHEPVKGAKLQVYQYFLQREAITEPVSILAFQASRSLDEELTKGFQHLLARLFRYKMQDVLFMSDGHDLMISNWGTDIIREKRTDYHVEHLFIPWRLIKGMSLGEHPRFSYLKTLQVQTQFRDFTFSVEADFSLDPLLDFQQKMQNLTLA
ncbi:hypothetical protein [Agarivorans sp. QJM3NY_25]|uniref:hypothetical protein n=1 Tax=Agarivorans sp. QJM3NY_25 TaxID=3421430 RepID=UPI003D7C38D2